MTTSSERRSVFTGLGIAIGIILLVGSAVGAHRPGLVVLMTAGVVATVLTVAKLLPGAAALTTTLATCIAIYTVAFAGGAIAIFHHAHWLGEAAAFVLPLLGFVAGVAWRKHVIQQRMAGRQRVLRDRILVRGMGWLCLCFLILIVVVALVPPGEDVVAATASLVGAMALSATTIWFADIASLLDETGALFHLFLTRMKSRIVPIFSFLVVFVFIGVLFAAIYALLDHQSAEPAFAMGGNGTRLTLPDAIYFSFVTLSTIGCGDVTPLDPLARVLVIAEIIFGVVLLLFAFAEIAAYDPEADLAEEAGGREAKPERDDVRT